MKSALTVRGDQQGSLLHPRDAGHHQQVEQGSSHEGSLHGHYSLLLLLHQCPKEASRHRQTRRDRLAEGLTLHQLELVVVHLRHRQMILSCHQGTVGPVLVGPETSTAGQDRLEETVVMPETVMGAVTNQQMCQSKLLDQGTHTLMRWRNGYSRTEGRRPWTCTVRVLARTIVLD